MFLNQSKINIIIMNYKVSVIMSVKDGEAYLEKSIESILNQSYGNLEFLICDDRSSDSTFEICNRYKFR